MVFKINKGLELPSKGKPDISNVHEVFSKSIGVLGKDYHGMKPTMLVQENENVIKGQPLFEDKKNPGVIFTAPASGVVSSINRGERRAFLSLIIEKKQDDQEQFDFISSQNLSDLSEEDVVKILVKSGLWTVLKTRPFSKIPKINERPNDIFISLIDSNPLSVDPEEIIKSEEDFFNVGIKVMMRLAKNSVNVSTKPSSNIEKLDLENLYYYEFDGPHPVGLVGTQIHTISPASLTNQIWTVGYQEVLMIGKLFKTGLLDNSKKLSLSGPMVSQPGMNVSENGANLDEILIGKIEGESNRIISGSVLNGSEAKAPENFLGRYHNQITVLREVNKSDREFLNFLRPGLKKHSFLRVFFTKLKEKGLSLNYSTAMNGSDRAIVPLGIYEDIFPYKIMITQLLRSIVVGDTETAQKLGVLELDEEDLALCTYSCPSKYDYGSLLREMLTKIEEEG